MRPPLEPTLVADLVALAAAPTGRATLVEAAGRRLTWAELEDEVGRVATGLGESAWCRQRVLLVWAAASSS